MVLLIWLTSRKCCDLIDEFNHSQDDIEVTTRYIPDADFKKELALGMYEGTMPDIAR